MVPVKDGLLLEHYRAPRFNDTKCNTPPPTTVDWKRKHQMFYCNFGFCVKICIQYHTNLGLYHPRGEQETNLLIIIINNIFKIIAPSIDKPKKIIYLAFLTFENEIQIFVNCTYNFSRNSFSSTLPSVKNLITILCSIDLSADR